MMLKPNINVLGPMNAFCARIGADPMLVQGAGGNVSWKDGNILWVKASGGWLADAADQNIFVPIDLPPLRSALDQGDFSVQPQVLGGSPLRPSIETLLHALMPQTVVVHVHAIEVLAHLVREDFHSGFNALLADSTPWEAVAYQKPGSPLAREIHAVLAKSPNAQVIFLANHGVVVGAADIAEADQILGELTQRLKIQPGATEIQAQPVSRPPECPMDVYIPIADLEIHQLAIHPMLFDRLRSDWALYPDHVVFLGPRAFAYDAWQELMDGRSASDALPELVFIRGMGVYAQASFGKAKLAQLRCYRDVLLRQSPHIPLRTLTEPQILELLNWDAEKYRMKMAK